MNQDELSAALNSMSPEQIRGLIFDDKSAPQTPQSTVIPAWLGSIPLGEIQMNDDMTKMLQMVDAAAPRAPHLIDSERLRPLLPKMPCQTATYYPQKVQPSYETLEYYTRLQPESLFFVFYFMEGTKAQLLAAKALKKLAWRYHTKYMMWFQRHEEPRKITDDFEVSLKIPFR
jgi:CCR4-NOT transcription complex subunit 3